MARSPFVALAMFALALVLALTPAAVAAEEGPALTVPEARLSAALSCDPGVATAKRDPVLLTTAFSSAQDSYGWNYLPQLAADSVPACSISVADEGYGDLQQTAEYVVYAVRRMAAMSGRQVVLLGHQHGALDELWAMRFWPDVARQVSDLVSLETPYGGTTSSSSLCRDGGHCSPALHQITKGSAFLDAVLAADSDEGPAITSIASTSDTLITPQPGASILPGARNILIQDVCPGRIVDHFAALADSVAYALFSDAINHAGPADPARLPADRCASMYMPKSNPVVLGLTSIFLAGFLARNAVDPATKEPAVAAYAVRTPPALSILTSSARVSRSGSVPVRLRCVSVGATACRAVVTLAGAPRAAGDGWRCAPPMLWATATRSGACCA